MSKRRQSTMLQPPHARHNMFTNGTSGISVISLLLGDNLQVTDSDFHNRLGVSGSSVLRQGLLTSNRRDVCDMGPIKSASVSSDSRILSALVSSWPPKMTDELKERSRYSGHNISPRMTFITSWEEFAKAAERLYQADPVKCRFVVKYRHCDGKLVLKVTDDQVGGPEEGRRRHTVYVSSSAALSSPRGGSDIGGQALNTRTGGRVLSLVGGTCWQKWCLDAARLGWLKKP
ncbi:Signal recognition particle protein [Branchiostoma belcheri]|nr:Signal recognition particle protein [Branchiostoma belcheri]